MALHDADDLVRAELVQRAVGEDDIDRRRATWRARPRPHASSTAAHARARRRRGSRSSSSRTGVVRSTTGNSSSRPPASTAHRCTCSDATSERTARRSHRTAPIATVPQMPGTGPATGSSTVSRASILRTPSTKAIRSQPSSIPSRGRQSSVSTVSSTEPSAGASSAASSGRAVLRGPALDEDARHTGGYYVRPPTPPVRCYGVVVSTLGDSPGPVGVDQHGRADLARTAMGVPRAIDRFPQGQARRIDARIHRSVAPLRPVRRCGGGEVYDGRRSARPRAAGLGEDHGVVRAVTGHVGDLRGEVLERGAAGRVGVPPHGAPRSAAVIEPAPHGDPPVQPEGVGAGHLPGDDDRVARRGGRVPSARRLRLHGDQRGGGHVARADVVTERWRQPGGQRRRGGGGRRRCRGARGGVVASAAGRCGQDQQGREEEEAHRGGWYRPEPAAQRSDQGRRPREATKGSDHGKRVERDRAREGTGRNCEGGFPGGAPGRAQNVLPIQSTAPRRR